ncbi:beta-microseminoprotein-like [Amphiprion ocellaris]|uniref:beta-microseminoprotein-like n=1 Tax=Amphiprion ocellaris TaxID=80972 RepID=UPI000C318DAD|nr:beta-microseminoprotein-like [Amphiprion ocellaris]
MKYLTPALLLCALLSLSDAFCTAKVPTIGMTHCQDDVDKTWHAVGSSWRNSACMDCTCDGCCSAYGIPRGIPDDCVSVFDWKACDYIVHKKDDPTVLCTNYARVGK